MVLRVGRNTMCDSCNITFNIEEIIMLNSDAVRLLQEVHHMQAKIISLTGSGVLSTKKRLLLIKSEAERAQHRLQSLVDQEGMKDEA